MKQIVLFRLLSLAFMKVPSPRFEPTQAKGEEGWNERRKEPHGQRKEMFQQLRRQ